MPIVLTMLIFLLLMPVSNAKAEGLRIAAASNFQHTLHQLNAEFFRQHGLQPTSSTASSGKLFAQLSHGAPYDLFLSADSERPRRLVATGKAVAGSRFTYAEGKLVLWSPTPGLFQDQHSATAFLASPARRIAYANPRLAPYGFAAEHVSIQLKIAAQVITAESIAQTFHFTVTNSVDAGFIAAAQLQQWHEKNALSTHSLWHVPPALHAPIEQQAVLLARAQNNPHAKAYLGYLQSPGARAIIRAAGYDTPSDSSDAPDTP